MTNLELVLNMLAEATTTEISKEKKPRTSAANRAVAAQGGRIAVIPAAKLRRKRVKRSFHDSPPNKSWRQRAANKSKQKKRKNKFAIIYGFLKKSLHLHQD